MLKIDAHAHPDFCDYGFDEIIDNMDKNGIGKSWLLSWETPVGDFDPRNGSVEPLGTTVPVPFSRCLAYKEKAPDRFILGYCPDPHDPGAIHKMRSAINTYHVQVCGEAKFRLMCDDPDCVDLWRFCGEHGLPVTLHMDYDTAQLTGHEFPRRHYWFGGRIENLENALKLCPETNFLGHAPGFWCHISADDSGLTNAYTTEPVIRGGKVQKLLETYPNLYCDCSAGSCHRAFSRDPAYAKELILTYPDRFLFARDCFDDKMERFLDDLDLPETVREMVFHGNAERLCPPVQRV